MKRATSIDSPSFKHFRSQAEMPAELIDHLRHCAREFGDTYASYLATELDREYFWATELEGFVAFRRLGRYVNVADGLIADPANRERLLAEFLAFTKQNNWVASFMNVPRNEINLFRRQGCQVTKCGEEALVQLEQTSWHGKEASWLRRQENYCKRHGVEVFEVDPDPEDPVYYDEIIQQLEEISGDHIDATLNQREMQFFVSNFSPHELSGRRLFVARDGSRIEGFIVCNPGLGGDFWAVEVYRRRQDAVRGVIPFIIMHAMREMKAEGVQYFSLSLAPFLRCNPVVDDSPVFRFVANSWWRYLNPIYDVQGIFHFKSRFRPDYREMYLAVSPGVTIRSLLVIAYVWKLFHFNPLRLLKRSLQHRRNAKQHSLAMPERRSRRAIRKLRPKQKSGDSAASEISVVAIAKQNNVKTHSHEEISI
jgi:phosphatidylglycerol lysyltransferase